MSGWGVGGGGKLCPGMISFYMFFFMIIFFLSSHIFFFFTIVFLLLLFLSLVLLCCFFSPDKRDRNNFVNTRIQRDEGMNKQNELNEGK